MASVSSKDIDPGHRRCISSLAFDYRQRWDSLSHGPLRGPTVHPPRCYGYLPLLLRRRHTSCCRRLSAACQSLSLGSLLSVRSVCVCVCVYVYVCVYICVYVYVCRRRCPALLKAASSRWLCRPSSSTRKARAWRLALRGSTSYPQLASWSWGLLRRCNAFRRTHSMACKPATRLNGCLTWAKCLSSLRSWIPSPREGGLLPRYLCRSSVRLIHNSNRRGSGCTLPYCTQCSSARRLHR